MIRNEPMNIRKPRNLNVAANRVLLVETDPALVSAVQGYVQLLGYDFFTVRTGGEAIDLVRNGFRGTIVLDGLLPDCDGRTVFDRIRHLDPSLPVVFAAEDLMAGPSLEVVRDDAFAFIEAGELMEELPVALADASRALGRQAERSRRAALPQSATGESVHRVAA